MQLNRQIISLFICIYRELENNINIHKFHTLKIKTMNDRVPISRDFNLEFPIDEVKKSIELVARLSQGSYKLENKNDIFNSYTFLFVAGITVLHPNIQLKKISEKETNLVLTDNIRNGNTISSNEIFDKFFVLLGRALSGEELSKKIINKEKAGCFTVLIALLGIGSAFYLLA